MAAQLQSLLWESRSWRLGLLHHLHQCNTPHPHLRGHTLTLTCVLLLFQTEISPKKTLFCISHVFFSSGLLFLQREAQGGIKGE